MSLGLRAAAVGLSVVIASCSGSAESIKVRQAWAPATPPGTSVGAAYMSIEAAQADTLLRLSSPAANSVEIHRTSFEEGIAQMRKVDSVIVSPNAPLMLEPNGMHVMLIGLAAPLQAGESISIALRFQNAGEVTTQVAIQSPTAQPAHH